MEAHERLHHVLGLPQRAELVVVTISVLLQEVILQHGRHIHCDLIRVTQGRLSDQLHDLVQVLRLAEQFSDVFSQTGELRVVFLVVPVEHRGVFTVRHGGVDGGEVLPLG